MSAHTPGPWAIEPDDNEQLNIYAEERAFWVALLPHQCVRSIEEQQKINARLIAAAPDLLAALRDAEVLIDSRSPMAEDVFQKTRAAIAKAEGRS